MVKRLDHREEWLIWKLEYTRKKTKPDFIFDIENRVFKVYGLLLRKKIHLMLLKFISVYLFHKGLSVSDEPGMKMKDSFCEMPWFYSKVYL